MFSTPESGRISDRWTAVRILGGDDLDAEGRAFMERYDLVAYPSVLAMTAGGALVDHDLTGGRLGDAAGLYAAMERADRANRAFVSERDRALAAGDEAGLRALADAMEARLDLRAASGVRERIAREHPSVAAYEEWFAVLDRLPDPEAERAAIDAALARFPDDGHRTAWRIRRATLGLEAPHDVEALEALRRELEGEGDAAGEAAVRVELARRLRASGDADAADAQLAWVLEHAPDSPAALDAFLQRAEAAQRRRDAGAVRESAGRVVERAPDSLEAARAHMMLGDLAYADGDLDGMEEHFSAVVRIAPGTPMAAEAAEALEAVKRRRARDAGN